MLLDVDFFFRIIIFKLQRITSIRAENETFFEQQIGLREILVFEEFFALIRSVSALIFSFYFIIKVIL